jgi:hypothetical protein
MNIFEKMISRETSIDSQAEYEAMLEFLRELIRTQDVDHKPYKSLWATAALFAADWEKLHDPWLKDEASSNLVSSAPNH